MYYDKQYLKKIIYATADVCEQLILHSMQEMAQTIEKDRDEEWEKKYKDLVEGFETCEEIQKQDILVLEPADFATFNGFDPKFTSFIRQTTFDTKMFITDMFDSQKDIKNLSKAEKSQRTWEENMQELSIDNWIEEFEETFETEDEEEMCNTLEYLLKCRFLPWGERVEEDSDEEVDKDKLPF